MKDWVGASNLKRFNSCLKHQQSIHSIVKNWRAEHLRACNFSFNSFETSISLSISSIFHTFSYWIILQRHDGNFIVELGSSPRKTHSNWWWLLSWPWKIWPVKWWECENGGKITNFDILTGTKAIMKSFCHWLNRGVEKMQTLTLWRKIIQNVKKRKSTKYSCGTVAAMAVIPPILCMIMQN